MEPAHAMDGRGRRVAVLSVLVLIASALAALGFARPAAALRAPTGAAATLAAKPTTPAGVHPDTGASINGLTEYLAVNGSTTGSVIGPDYTQGDLATEAVGREAVQLNAGQSLTFTLTATANAFDLSYAVPQGSSGTLTVAVNGTPLSTKLNLTSAYSYISTPDITGSKTHHFFNDVRMMLGQTLSAGAKVTFEVGSGDTAVPYTIDVADFFNVPAAASQPANSISVVSEGADPTGTNDSTSAFSAAISAAASAGESVWIPQGTYLVNSALQFSKATIVGAGAWYSVIKSNEFIDNTSSVSGPINLSGFSIMGNTVGRHDDSSANAINGSLGSGYTVNGLWIQDTNVGFWLQYGNSNCTVENSIVLSTDADGLNFNGNATNCTVTNNFIRNTGDDGLAIWSYPAADSGITFSNNTVEQPNLANGIADYGGSNNTITGNVIADTNALGSGLDISNEQFLSPGFAPLSGTITVSNNTLIRTGAENPNWGHPMGAVQIDAYDYAISGATINLSGNNIENSPYCAYEIVSGSGNGYAVNGVNINGDTVTGTGTVVFQAETQGSISVSNLKASNVGVAGIYNNPYPSGSGTFTLNAGSGNSGWSTTPVLTTFPSPVVAGALTASPTSLAFGDVTTGTTSTQTVTVANPGSSAQTISGISVTGSFSQTNNCGSSLAAGASCTVTVKFAPTTTGALTGTLTIANSSPTPSLTVSLAGTGVNSSTNLALGATMTASGYTQTYVPANANDGNTSTYWESTDNAFPQWLEANLGSVLSVGSVTLDLPPSSSWGTRTQTLSILGSTNGSSWTTLAGSASYTFNPSTGNTVTISLPTSSVQYLQLNFTANSAWPAGQISEFEIFSGGGGGGGGTGCTQTNLALCATMTASGYTQTYVPANANDGNTSTYWESTDNAFPQYLEAGFTSAQTVGSITIDLPPSSSWATRTQTLSVLGSTNGSTWITLVGSATYTFNPSTGNTVTISLPTTSVQYLKLNFTANSGWPAGQASEFQIFA